jgi:hypothetical protein
MFLHRSESSSLIRALQDSISNCPCNEFFDSWRSLLPIDTLPPQLTYSKQQPNISTLSVCRDQSKVYNPTECDDQRAINVFPASHSRLSALLGVEKSANAHPTRIPAASSTSHFHSVMRREWRQILCGCSATKRDIVPNSSRAHCCHESPAASHARSPCSLQY